MAELVFHGDQAFQAVTGIVKTVTKQVEEQLSQENDAELDKLRNSLGMGARGKGVHKALRGYEASVRDLEEKQKKRRTRAIRDSLDLSLVDLAGLYRDAIMISSHADVPRTHPDMVGLAEELAQRVSAEGLVACVDAINLCREHINHNVRPEVAFDAMIGRIRLACGAH